MSLTHSHGDLRPRRVLSATRALVGLGGVGLLLGLGACSDNILGDDRAIDTDAPVVIITKPERGTILPDNQIEVAGRVEDRDSEITGVTVNGNPVALDSDGRFSILLSVSDGITLVQTVATDTDDNHGTDSRAVMAGNLVVPETPAFDGIAGRIGRDVFENINQTTVNLLESPDEVSRLAENFNPVVDAGGSCFGVEMDLDTINVSNANVQILPVDGGITFDVDLTDLEILMSSDFEVACIGGSSGVSARADRARVTGQMNIGMDRGQLVVELADISSDFVDVDIDVGVIKSEIIETFLRDLDGTVEGIVENFIRGQVSKLVDGFLFDATRGEWEVSLAGADLVFGATPTEVVFDDEGGFFTVDTLAMAKNPLDNIGYISTPSTQPIVEMRDYENFRAVVADDFLNQAFAAYWSSGALANAVAFDSNVEDKQSFLGNAIDRVEVTVLLPPYVDARNDKEVSITVGDVILDIINESAVGDQVVTRLALSGTVTLAVDIDHNDRLKLKTDAPDLWVDVLTERDGVIGPNPFSRDEIEVLASFVASRFAGAADDLIGQIPIPSIAGTKISELQLEPDRGYITLGGALDIPGN